MWKRNFKTHFFIGGGMRESDFLRMKTKTLNGIVARAVPFVADNGNARFFTMHAQLMFFSRYWMQTEHS